MQRHARGALDDTDQPFSHDEASTESHSTKPKRKMLHPIMVMVWILLAAVATTYFVDAGRFDRKGKLVVPGTYHTVPKSDTIEHLFSLAVTKPAEDHAAPASLVSAFVSVPHGLIKNAPLIVMVMFIGGMFGVLKKTGVVDAGIDRLLNMTSGNIYILAPILMLLIGLGSTLLGFASEYIIIIPLVVGLTQRLGLSNLIAVAIVTVPSKLGYLSSVTNPLSLGVAQPLVGVPLFSGIPFRAAIFAIFVSLGMLHLLYHVRRSGYSVAKARAAVRQGEGDALSGRHRATLLVLAVATGVLIFGTQEFEWGNVELSAFYIVVSMVAAAVGRLDSRSAAESFVDGMKTMILAALLIGLATSIQLILQNSSVLDTLINSFTQLANGQSTSRVANGLMAVEMALGVFIPSTSGKAAVSMPILGPIAQLSGVTGQTTVLAFLLGGGLVNLITPTSGILLAYLATAKVGFVEWFKYVFPLFVVLLVLAVISLVAAVQIGY